MKTIAIVLCLVAGVCFADDFMVHMNMLIDEEANVDLAESLIRRELRSLGDVEITDDYREANWYLDIAIVYRSTLHIGFLSIWYRREADLIQRYWNTDEFAFDAFASDEMAANVRKALLELTFSFRSRATYYYVQRELRDLVEGLILAFDTELDEFRPGGRNYSEEGE